MYFYCIVTCIVPALMLYPGLAHTSDENRDLSLVPARMLATYLAHEQSEQLHSRFSVTSLDSARLRAIRSKDSELSHRCKLLDDLLVSRLDRDQSTEDIMPIPGDPRDHFYPYARQLIVCATKHYGTLVDYFHDRRKLRAWCRKHLHGCHTEYRHQLIKPACLNHTATFAHLIGYYTALPPAKTWPERPWENPTPNTPCDESCTSPVQTKGLLWGIVRNDGTMRWGDRDVYRLYACDPHDGYAVWATPFTRTARPYFPHTITMPYALMGQRIYAADDANTIHVMDHAGHALGTSAGLDDTPLRIYVDDQHVLYHVYEHTIVIEDLCNLDTIRKHRRFVDVPKDIVPISCELVDNTLVAKVYGGGQVQLSPQGTWVITN